MATVYVVGEMSRTPWEMVGVFSTRELALAACVRYSQFIAPLEMDQSTPEETTVWPGVEYPLTFGGQP